MYFHHPPNTLFSPLPLSPFLFPSRSLSFMFHVHNGLLCCETKLQDTEHFSKKPLLIFMPLTIKAKARNWQKNLKSHSKPPFIYS